MFQLRGIATLLIGATAFAIGCAKEIPFTEPVARDSVVVAQFDPTNPIPVLQLVPAPTSLAQNIDGTLNVFRNPNLNDLRGLRNLEVVGDEVLVHHNAALASISDLERLRSTGDLFVSSNSILTRIGLDRLATVEGDLRIIGNPSLPQVDAELFAAGLVVTGVVDVSDNAP